MTFKIAYKLWAKQKIISKNLWLINPCIAIPAILYTSERVHFFPGKLIATFYETKR